jgi:hypothetical protein
MGNRTWCRSWGYFFRLLIMKMSNFDRLVFVSSFCIFMNWGVRIFNVTLNSLF